MHILTANISRMAIDMTHSTIAIKSEVADEFSITILTF